MSTLSSFGSSVIFIELQMKEKTAMAMSIFMIGLYIDGVNRI